MMPSRLAQEEGIELDDRQLESIAGRFWEGCDLCDLGSVGSSQ